MTVLFLALILITTGCFCFLSNPFLNVAGTDSSIFLYVARLFNEGNVFYRDVFDQKGPLIFIINAIGLRICENSFMGIWLLDCIAYLGALFLSFRLSSRFVERKYALVTMAPLAAIYHLVACGGNMPEMYIIVFSLLAYDICISGKKWAVLDCLMMGACVGLILMLKLNMIVVVIPIGICWICKREKVKNFFFIAMGCLMAVLPFIIYLWANNALMSFWEIYIEYNSQYARPYRLLPEINRGCMIVAVTAVLNGMLCRNRSLNESMRSALLLNFIYLMATWGLIVVSGGTNRYYGPILPACVLPIASFLLLCKKYFFRIVFIVSEILLVLIMFQRNLCYGNQSQKESLDRLRPLIKDKESVTVLGCDCFVYMYLNVKSPTRFPYQGTIAHTSNYYRNKILEDINNQKSKYLIVPDDVLNTDGSLGVSWAKSMVFERYEMLLKRGHYSLYKRRVKSDSE